MALSLDDRRTAKARYKSILSLREYRETRLNITFPCTDTDIHTFSVIKGDLFFFNHDMKHLKALAVMDKLQHSSFGQSEACGCVKVMRMFMDKVPAQEIPYNLFSSAMKDRLAYPQETRSAKEEFKKLFPPGIPPSELIARKFCGLVTDTIRKGVTYREPSRDQYGDEVKTPLVINVSIGEVGINGYLKAADGRNGHDKAVLDVVLPFSYYGKVYNKGLSIIDGNLVLAKLYEFNEDSFLGLVGKQTYGYKVVAEHAVIHPKRNHISWISEEKAREILVKGKTPRSRRTKEEMNK